MSKFGDLSKRLVVASLVVSIVIVLVAFAMHPLVRFLVVGAICLLVATGVLEFAKLAKTKGLSPAVHLMILIAIGEVIAFMTAHQWIHSHELPVVVFAIGLGLFFLNRFRNAEGALVNVAVEFFGVVYVAVPLSYMLAILYPIAPSTVEDGRWWLFYLLIVTKVTDVAAYFIGRMMGKVPLAPHLSPKKTIEGAAAGLLCATFVSMGMVAIGRVFAGSSFPLEYYDALWLGLLIGVFGQIGDLAESLLKRDAAVKDSNRIPGIGGVLDLVDSLIFTAPIVYYYLRWISLP
jgi:phosphatidate cytidylyltransferase